MVFFSGKVTKQEQTHVLSPGIVTPAIEERLFPGNVSESELSPVCRAWQIGDVTKHPPADSAFLEALARAGFLAFTGPSGLCGGKSDRRSAIVIHRGHGTRWEIVFREHETDVVTTTTTDLGKTTSVVLSWLRGGVLAAQENSLRAVAG